jgi:hypothetical protein
MSKNVQKIREPEPSNSPAPKSETDPKRTAKDFELEAVSLGREAFELEIEIKGHIAIVQGAADRLLAKRQQFDDAFLRSDEAAKSRALEEIKVINDERDATAKRLREDFDVRIEDLRNRQRALRSASCAAKVEAQQRLDEAQKMLADMLAAGDRCSNSSVPIAGLDDLLRPYRPEVDSHPEPGPTFVLRTAGYPTCPVCKTNANVTHLPDGRYRCKGVLCGSAFLDEPGNIVKPGSGPAVPTPAHAIQTAC